MIRNALAIIGLSLSLNASAALIDISYSGSVTAVANPGLSGDVAVGDAILVSLRYDTNDLVDVSMAPGLPAFGVDNLPGLKVATLAGPNNFLSITIGTHMFAATDDFDFGSNAGLGGFPSFPLVVFLNGSLLGVEISGIFNDDLDFNLLSIERYTLPDLITDDVIGSDFRTDEFAFVGSLDVANARITQVPEPATLALLLLGFVGVGAARARRKAVPPS